MDMTLEQWTEEQVRAAGADPADPQVAEQVRAAVEEARAASPGKSDAEIIAEAEPTTVIEGGAPAVAAVPAPSPAPDFGAAYREKSAQLNQQYSPEEEQKLRDAVNLRNSFVEAGRALGSGARISAGPEYARQLDADYAAQLAANRQPLEDWQARKASAIKQLESEIKTGEVTRSEIQTQMLRLGYDQAIKERATKEAIAAAESNPSSATSEGMRALARRYAPKLVEQLGDRFNQLSAQQLKGFIPTLEKAYLKELDLQGKKLESEDKALDRASREKVANINAGSRITAANIKAASKGGGAGGAPQPKIGEVLRADKLESDLDKQQRAELDKAEGASETIKLFDDVEKLIKGGLETGPIVGGDNIIGRAYSLVSSKKQQANQLAAQLVASMAKTFGAAPSDAEARLIREANTVMQLDDPLPVLTQLKGKFERAILERQAAAAAIQERKNQVRATVGREPQASPTGMVRMTGPDGRVYSIPADRVDEAKRDGLRIGG